VFHEPHGHTGNLYGEFFQLNAVKLANADLDERANVQRKKSGIAFCFRLESQQHLQLQFPQLPIGNNKKITAATGRIEKSQRSNFGMEIFKSFLFALFQAENLLKFLMKFIKEERTHHLQDVLFAGVVRPKGTPLVRVHDGLEH